MARPELSALTALTAIVNLWALGRNGWANTRVTLATSAGASSKATASGAGGGTAATGASTSDAALYDCQGRAAALAAA